MIYLRLFLTFMKIGVVSFGGGYAMIPLIMDEVISQGWMAEAEIIQIIAISEMTPGPIAINMATYVGYTTAGVLGAGVATLGVITPALLLINVVAMFFFRHKDHPMTRSIFKYIRPIVAGLIIASVMLVAQKTILPDGLSDGFRIETVLILGMLIIVYLRKQMHPILLIGLAAALGLLFGFIILIVT